MKLPDFLEGITLEAPDTKRLSPVMKNWLTAHAYIRTLNPDAKGLREVQLMLVYEITISRRLHMLQRLRARYNNLRIKHEDKQLFQLAQR